MAALECPSCGAGTNRLIFAPTIQGETPVVFCEGCRRGRIRDGHVYTGRKFWTGEEVYGAKKLQSDEFRADLERDLAPSSHGDHRGRKGVRDMRGRNIIACQR